MRLRLRERPGRQARHSAELCVRHRKMKLSLYVALAIFTSIVFGCSEMRNSKSDSQTRLLTRQEYLGYFAKPMTELDPKEYAASGVWLYVSNIPRGDFREFEIAEGYIPFIYKSGDDKYDHVHVSTKTANVYLVILYDRKKSTIIGHHLLDLNEKYGMGRN